MKPTKNRVHCKECGRVKMLFESEKKAQLFMKFNNEEIAEESDKVPARAYYCEACGGWHLTHLSEPYKGASLTEQLMDQYQASKEIKRAQQQKNAEIKTETTLYVKAQMEEAERLVAEKEYTKAMEILDSILELGKTKYIKPCLLKATRKKREEIINIQKNGLNKI